jgi:hypothetical protein
MFASSKADVKGVLGYKQYNHQTSKDPSRRKIEGGLLKNWVASLKRGTQAD